MILVKLLFALFLNSFKYPGAEFSKAAKVLADMDIRSLHGIYLGLCRTTATADNSTGMAHASARGCRQAGYKTDYRLGNVICNKGTGLLFCRAAYLTNHHDGTCFRVILKSGQAVNEVGAVDRVSANADAG
jgi:hypothetical protein